MVLLQRKRQLRFLRTPRFFRWFRRNTEAVHCRGNHVQLYFNGGEFFPAMLLGFQKAVRCIEAEFYLIRNDHTGREFADALISAAGRGVQVSLLYDYIGCFDTPAVYFKRLEKGGVTCLPFNPPPFKKGLSWFDRRDHRKMAIIDGGSAFLGSMNVANEYGGFGESPDRWRDVGVCINGPAGAELQSLFRESWREQGGTCCETDERQLLPEYRGEAEVMIVSGGPHKSRSLVRSAFLMAIAGASESVKIMTPYFVPGPRFVRSLLRAVRRGVRVQLVLPSRSDVRLVRLVSRSYYAALLRGGIEIFERQGTMLHAKAMLIDNCWAVIGSSNLDLRSFYRNYEINVVVDSHEFGWQMAGMIEEDMKLSRPIELAEHERRGWYVRLMERLFATASWFL